MKLFASFISLLGIFGMGCVRAPSSPPALPATTTTAAVVPASATPSACAGASSATAVDEDFAIP